jgi:hypothetical protein
VSNHQIREGSSFWNFEASGELEPFPSAMVSRFSGCGFEFDMFLWTGLRKSRIKEATYWSTYLPKVLVSLLPPCSFLSQPWIINLKSSIFLRHFERPCNIFPTQKSWRTFPKAILAALTLVHMSHHSSFV